MSTPAFASDRFYVALDTSGPVGHVAVARGADVLARERLEHRGEHASRLVPAVRAALERASVDAGDIAGIVVGEGPGSFTGVRVAAATAKALARAWSVPLWPVSSLAAAALGDRGAGAPQVRYVLFDARADRVYAACYGVGTHGMETLVPPHASDLHTVLGEELPVGVTFTGDGAERHRAAIEGAGFSVLAAPVGVPSGDALICYMALHPEEATVPELATWEPRYVKASSAERAWTA